ncbi:NAD(P)H-binding protein [Rurimicrobium arvi]
MNITITGSLGNIGRHLVPQLTAAGHHVTVVTSNAERSAAIEQAGAKAAVGSVTDADFLTRSFTGADAVFAMTPPNMGGSDIIAGTVAAGKAFAQAIGAANVKRVVMLSSIGADKAGGNGPIAGLHQIEGLYGQLKDVNVTFLRAGYFYTNSHNDIPLIKTAGIVGANYPASTLIPFVHPKDIAASAAEALVQPGNGKDVQYIVSDLRSADDYARLIGAAIGKPELPWVQFTDEQSMGGMTQAGLPEEIAALYTEMGAGLRNGSIQQHFNDSGKPLQGATKLEAYAQEFASHFSA